MSARRRDFPRSGFSSAALLALLRTQRVAAAATALYRNQQVDNGGAGVPAHDHDTQPRCPIVELRQYTLQPNTRERFVALFEREFIESQERLGMTVIGQFRDRDDPDRFVWLRGFTDMAARGDELQAFYGAPAPAWRAHREEANSMIVDSDDVLLLRAPTPAAEFALARMTRPTHGTSEELPGLLVATIYYLDAPADAEFIGFFEHRIVPELRAHGISVAAYFASETSANNFPRLPVREKEPVFVWFAIYKDQADYQQHTAALAGSARWRETIAADLRHRLQTVPQTLRLAPTPRSLLHA